MTNASTTRFKFDNVDNPGIDHRDYSENVPFQSNNGPNPLRGGDVRRRRRHSTEPTFFKLSQRWFPSATEPRRYSSAPLLPTYPELNETNKNSNVSLSNTSTSLSSSPRRTPKIRRTWRRRLFLVLTEPETSIASAVFYFILISAIALSNMIGIMQTMDSFQFTPTDCVSCGGNVSYMFEDDDMVMGPGSEAGITCVCPPSPQLYTVTSLNWLMNFLAVEWMMRVALFTPANLDSTKFGQLYQWIQFLTSHQTVIDALAIFPYYLENVPNGFVSLRLLRLFRLFQLIRLGKYNVMFLKLTNVLQKAFNYLKLLVLVLAFGAVFFGSMMYWFEKGHWKFDESLGEYRFLRTSMDGVTEEPTPFTSIPAAFWWFIVTATTVGYGDYYPTSTGGKWCAIFAMLSGVLVVAFPVSVFSDLWSNELKTVKEFDSGEGTVVDDDDESFNGDDAAGYQAQEDYNGNDRTPLTSPEKQSLQATDRAQDYQAIYNGGVAQTDRPIQMQPEHVKEIFDCLAGIKTREERIKQIFLEYNITSNPN